MGAKRAQDALVQCRIGRAGAFFSECLLLANPLVRFLLRGVIVGQQLLILLLDRIVWVGRGDGGGVGVGHGVAGGLQLMQGRHGGQQTDEKTLHGEKLTWRGQRPKRKRAPAAFHPLITLTPIATFPSLLC